MRPTTAISALVAFTLVAPTGAAGPLINQIDNGDFEDFTDDDPDEWRLLAGNADPTEDAADGQRAVVLNFAGDSSSTSGIAQEVSLDRLDVPIVPTWYYPFSFNSKLETETDSGVEAQAKIVWRNVFGEVSRVLTISIPVVEDQQYDTIRYGLSPPTDAVEADIQFELTRTSPTSSTGTAFKIDNVVFGPPDYT